MGSDCGEDQAGNRSIAVTTMASTSSDRERNILMVAARFHPHVGGVERHLRFVCKELIERGYGLSVLTDRYNRDMPSYEVVDGVHVHRHTTRIAPRLPRASLPFSSLSLMANYYTLFDQASIVHCHDWLPFIKLVLPFRMLMRTKPFFVTYHGWSGVFPPLSRQVMLANLVQKLTRGSICIGDFISKWYHLEPSVVLYGASSKSSDSVTRGLDEYDCCYVGRLEPDNDILSVVESWRILQGNTKKRLKIVICGDGSQFDEVKRLCSEYQLDVSLKGFVTDVASIICSSELIFANSYLTIIESLLEKKPVFTIYQNQLKQDYLTLMPGSNHHFFVADRPEALAKAAQSYLSGDLFFDLESGYQWAKEQTWQRVADTYEKLWRTGLQG
ncbi:MAG: glycosyltransferase family 4 protein [Proteobacteria bacterium]|nr:glycosyltransferase family 4 protein [Pseudomonadota bacterium]